MRKCCAVLLAALLAVSLSPGHADAAGEGIAAGRLAPPTDRGLFLNILPAGQGSNTTTQQALEYQATGQRPPHHDDQLAMYRDLPTQDLEALTDGDLTQFFKVSSFGPTGPVERSYTPREGLRIDRDAFGVPHIYGDTRADAMFGAGYVLAEDRMFMADVLRHVGRGRMSELLGPAEANLAMDHAMYLVAGYSEAELEQQIDRLERYGAPGRQAIRDGLNYVEGINARIDELIADPSKLPAEYGALQIEPTHWQPTDVVAIATLIQSIFGAGGGNELGNARFLQQAVDKHGPRKARRLWRDLRSGNDPEAQVSADRAFPYMLPGRVNRRSVARPDKGSLHAFDPIRTDPQSEGEAGAPAVTAAFAFDPYELVRQGMDDLGLGVPGEMSNWLGITADEAAGGHPIAVMGPQVSYFSPQILLEEYIHAPGLNARGAAFPGISQYVLLGRGTDYAWSATSASSDIVDTRAERLCEPGGSEPSVNSTHYVFRGECRAMTVREDSWVSKPSAGGPGPPTQVTAIVHRTVHGPVIATGTVRGKPVAFVTQRSTFFAELDAAPGFVLMNGSGIQSSRDFQRAMGLVTSTFNWLYVDDRNVAYFQSGKYPVRPRGVNPYLPVWGTGQWEWNGFLPFAGHPRAVNPDKGWIESWNNKPAPGWNASDANWAYQSLHRGILLEERLKQRIRGGPVQPSDVVAIMADAATVDLRGQEDLPVALRLIGNAEGLGQYLELLRDWVASGAHRVDRDGDGQYDDQAAVALMDAWWPRLVHATLNPTLAGLYDAVLLPLDDENRAAGLGSSFQGGYYGYVHKVVRMALGDDVAGRYRVLRCADGTRAGCRDALVRSLRATVDELGQDPSTWDANEDRDDIRYSDVGLVSIDPQPWQNRPTFQQVVQVTSHRSR